MPPKPTTYQKRFRVLRAEAERGSMRAMEELRQRYHVNRLMMNGELVSLNDRLKESLRRL
jgi:hypothetical protein